MDRCQLGHSDQVWQLDSLKSEIVASVAQSCISCAGGVTEPNPNSAAAFLVAYSNWEENGESDQARDDLHAALYREGMSNDNVAYIIRSLGFSAVKKFPPDFDSKEAGMLTFLLLSPFLSKASSALRTHAFFKFFLMTC